MTPEQIIAIARDTMIAALWIAAPILLSATLVSLVINIVQVMTSIQDSTVTIVPRLAAVGTILFFLLPWMLHRMMSFTMTLWSDFRGFAH